MNRKVFKSVFLFLIICMAVSCTKGKPFKVSELVGWICIISFGFAVVGGLIAMFSDEGEMAGGVAIVGLITALILLA
jgi:hypothetical protein